MRFCSVSSYRSLATISLACWTLTIAPLPSWMKVVFRCREWLFCWRLQPMPMWQHLQECKQLVQVCRNCADRKSGRGTINNTLWYTQSGTQQLLQLNDKLMHACTEPIILRKATVFEQMPVDMLYSAATVFFRNCMLQEGGLGQVAKTARPCAECAWPALLGRRSSAGSRGQDRQWGRRGSSREWSRSDRQGTAGARTGETWEGRRWDDREMTTCALQTPLSHALSYACV